MALHPTTAPAERYRAARARTRALARRLSAEDAQVQGPEYASPTKWHLAHTTWFFDAFVLQGALGAESSAPSTWATLFNSYYEAMGPRHPRPQRGMLSRPGLQEVLAWRDRVDQRMEPVLQAPLAPALSGLLELGLAHEEQHQELILTDILANFACNPLEPAWDTQPPGASAPAPAYQWLAFDGGLVQVGTDGPGFHFDNESPAHRCYLAPFALRNTLVDNGEVLGFVQEGGYREPSLWLSDGMDHVRALGLEHPWGWRREPDGTWSCMGLHGRHALDLHAPAVHLSAYEADAIATWLGARLPTEQEWEHAALSRGGSPQEGRWQGSGPATPRTGTACGDFDGLWGEVWQWTRSAYLPYPGYRPFPGAVGEYNGKFMSGQWVLRGGSCITPPGHVRPTYRNFFQPHHTWQFSGLRLAR